MAKLAIPLGEKVLFNIDETAALLGIGRDLVYRLIREPHPVTRKPRLHSVCIGRRRLVSRRALELFIEQEDN